MYKRALILEALDGGAGRKWLVRIIQAGRSLNGRYYSPEVLRKALPLFEGTKVFVYTRDGDKNLSTANHLKNLDPELDEQIHKDGLVTNLVGFLKNVTMSGNDVIGEIHFVVDWLADRIKAAWDVGKRDLVGLSILSDNEYRQTVQDDEVIKIHQVFGLDVVSQPAAGGRFITTTESLEQEFNLMDWLKRLKEISADLYGRVEAMAKERSMDLTTLTIEQLKEANPDLHTDVAAALAAAEKQKETSPPAAPAGEMEEDDDKKKLAGEMCPMHGKECDGYHPASEMKDEKHMAGESLEDRLATFQKQYAADRKAAEEREKRNWKSLLSSELATSGLPKVARKFIGEALESEVGTVEDIRKHINVQRDIIAESLPNRPQFVQKITDGKNERNMMGEALEGLLAGKDINDTPRYASFRQFYIHATDGKDPDMSFGGGNRALMAEAVDTSQWSGIFVDAMHKRIVDEVKRRDKTDWRKITHVRSGVTDFKNQNTTRAGDYDDDDFVVVGEGQTPPAHTSPDDERITWNVSKYSGIERVSLEALRNDDLNAISRIPEKIAKMAIHKFWKWFWVTMIESNPTFAPDSTALFHANHNNLSNTAAGEPGVRELSALIENQTHLSSGEKMGIPMRYVAYPIDNTKSVEKAIMDAIGIEPGRLPEDDEAKLLFIKSLNISPIRVPEFVDVNDYYGFCSANDLPTMEVGFLDGKEQPEVVQLRGDRADGFHTDFTIRFQSFMAWGGAVIDYRGAAKQSVT